MIRFEPYEATRHHDIWNDFIKKSKNGTFLFDRSYMDYHADRFQDASLMVYDDATLVAVLPANKKNDLLVSHGGLTYGGFITDDDMTTPLMIDIFANAKKYLVDQGFKKLVYKVMPRIYCKNLADEDLYALFIMDACQVRVDVSTTIDLQRPLRLSKGRKYSLSLAKRAQLVFEESEDYTTFHGLLSANLGDKHGVSPVHSTEEIALLAGRFPEQIKLYAALSPEREMLAGTLVFDCGPVVHTQYMASAPEGRKAGALDFVLITLMSETYKDRRYFDFGISTIDAGRTLNTGLIAQKEMFGGRAMIHQFYELDL